MNVCTCAYSDGRDYERLHVCGSALYRIIIGHVQQCIYNSSKVHTVQDNLRTKHTLHNWKNHVDCVYTFFLSVFTLLEVVFMVRLCLTHFPAK